MSTVNYRIDGHVAYIGLNRPERLNSINDDLRRDMRAVLEEFEHDDTRVAILYGEGRAFCTGMDLTPSDRKKPHTLAEDRERIHSIANDWLRLFDHPKPIIAQVHGYCIAGGTQLPLCCDIVTIAEDTQVGWPKLPVGAGWISPMWSHFIGVQKAKYMSFSIGSTITGKEAAEWGYATFAFSAEELEEETRRIADEIAKVPSDMLRIKKLSNNKVLERQGFREATLTGAEWDAIAHSTDTVELARDWIKEYGLKEAIQKFKREGM